MSGAIGKSRTRILAVAGLLCTAAAVYGGERVLSHSEYQLKKMTEKEDTARSGRITEIEKSFQQGKDLWQAGKYADARVKMEQALVKMAAVPGNEALNRYADLLCEYNQMCEEWGLKLFEAARKKYAKGDYNGAMSDAPEALTAFRGSHAFAYVVRGGAKMLAIPGDLYDEWMKAEKKLAARLDDLSRMCQGRLKATSAAREASLAQVDEKLEENKVEIEKLRRQVGTYVQQKQYAAAIDALEKIYLIDPYDVYATSALKKIYSKMYAAGVARREADIQGVMAAMMWRWVEPVGIGRDAETDKKAESNAPSADMFAKLDRIILPTLEFDQSDINAVIKHLNQRSRTYDPMHEGVNFSISMTDAERALLNKVDMRFANIPLSEALRYICQDLGLKYRVDADGVTIGTTVDNMQTRVFPARVDLISKITDEVAAPSGGESSDGMDAGGGDAAPGGGGSGGSGGGSATGGEGGSESSLGTLNEGKDYTSEGLSTASGRKNTVTPAQLKAAFEDWGIAFGPGTAVSYDQRGNRLRVTNTVENLQRLGKLLRQMDAVETPLVLVEVKLLEVTEHDLQELGFDWAFSMNNSSPSDTSKNNNWQAGTTNPLRNSNQMLGLDDAGSSLSLIKDLKLLPNFGNGLISGVNMDLSLTINAVSQNSRVETLSAPKLITSNGHEAMIKLSRSYYFPEDWEEPELENSGDYTTVTQPIPEWGDSGTDVGIIMTVRPQVDPNNSDITLELEPRVVSYIGKTDDTVKISGGYINYQDNVPQYIETWGNTYDVWMPILGERYLKTTVKVKDGETLVLGGMVDNKMESVYDRWPVLGDIPLIGRLFSSQYEKQENSSLLIFVTARLMNNNGMPFEQNVQPDIPDFRR